MLQEKERPVTAICTSTLELGIDIGSVVSIGQVGPPHSVAALRQRLGRSGRTPSDPSVLRLYVSEADVTPRSALQDRLRPELVQSVAAVSLLLENWCEPAEIGALHLSTLVQQTLSLIAQHSGARAGEIWRALGVSGPFHGLAPAEFAEFLRSLAAHDLIQQTGDGSLVLGRSGERLVDHFTFYVAFSTPTEYRLVAGGEMLGTLPVAFPLAVDSHLIFAGRRWRVVAVDDGATIHVEPAAGGRAPQFMGAGGFVHDEVRRRMLRVYLDPAEPAYLDRRARELLGEARTEFHDHELGTRSFVEQAGEVLVFLWAGDRALATVLLHLRTLGISASHDGLAIAAKSTDPESVRDALEAMLEAPPDPVALARVAEGKQREKHHRYLTPALLDRDYASSVLDVEGARLAVAAALGQPVSPA